MITIEFKDAKEVQVLIDMYLNKIKNKKDEISSAEIEVRELNAKVMQLRMALQGGAGSYGQVTSEEVYSEKWQWVKKIQFALEFAKRPLTTTGIFDVLVEFEPGMNADRRKSMSSLSGTLSLKSGTYEDRKDFIRSEGLSGEYSYSVWKEDYTYKKDEVIYSGNQILIEDLPY